jgi:2-iminobutanoate/2-iminopropanoate deaminase
LIGFRRYLVLQVAKDIMTLLDFNQEVCIIRAIIYGNSASQRYCCRQHSKLRGSTMRKTIQTPDAPKPVGPYSQAVQIDNLLFCSGQIAIDPKTDQVMTSADVGSQAKLVMENIRGLLSAADLDFKNIIKTTIFLTDMADFATVNEVYSKYFPQGTPYPARSTIAVAGLPKGVKVEIEVVAHRG